MPKHKHVSRSVCYNGPTALVVALLDCIQEIGGNPDLILRTAGASYGMGELKSGRVDVDIAVFTRINRACNARLRDHIEKSGNGGSLNEDQFYLLCKCLVGSADLEEAVGTTSKFFAMFDGRLGRIDLDIVGRSALLRIAPLRHGLSDASFLIDVYGIAVMHMLYEWLTAQTLKLDCVQLAYPRTSQSVFVLGLFDCPIKFGHPFNCLRFDSDCLRRPVVRTQSDLASLLTTFPFDLMLGGPHKKPLSEQIYITMMNAHIRTRRMPTVDQVARLFGVSSWTLRRRLAEEGTAYSKIRRMCQLNLATEFLRRSELTIDQVADIANFSDASAFRRAFQQWTGRSPSAYREAILHA